MFEIAFTQHRGNKPSQQDALLVGDAVYQADDLPWGQLALPGGPLLVAIADGVSSSPLPHRASRLALEALADEVAAGAAFDGRLIHRVHGRLCDRLARGKSFGAATTLVAAWCHKDQCVVLNVGDSRAYHIPAAGAWRQLSHDHTVIQGLIDRGEADAGVEYASLYRGIEHCLVADDAETGFPVHRGEFGLSPGDGLLLCSDGVHEVLGGARLARLANPCMPATAQVEAWREAVLAAGAPDNLSMLLVRSGFRG